MKKLLLLVFVFYCCTSMPLREAVKVKTNKFDSHIKISGVALIVSEDNISYQYFIESFISKETREVSHQINVKFRYFWGWQLYNRANIYGGEKFNIIGIYDDINHPPHNGIYSFKIILPNGYLKSHKDGFSIKVSADASGHSFIIEINSIQVYEQIIVIDAYTSLIE